MANPLKVTKCVATPTNVILYFSEALDVTSLEGSVPSPPESIENYAVESLSALPPDHKTFEVGLPVAVVSARYDVINRATVLQLETVQAHEQWLRVTVKVAADAANKIASGGTEISSPIVVRVQVDAAAKPSDAELQKILQPSYAIGMKVISQDDYNNLKNEYFAQCELSLGLIIPMILIVLGLKLTPEIGLKGAPWLVMCAAMAPISTVLFLVGAERYHKYRMELKLLILGNWERLQEAKKQAAGAASGAASPSKAIQKAVADAIEKAGLEKGSLKVKVDATS